MKKGILYEDDVRRILRNCIKEFGSQRNFAHFAGTSESQVSFILHGKRHPSKEVLAALGLTRVVTYRPAGL